MVSSHEAGFYRFEWVTAHIPSDYRVARSSSPNYISRDTDQKLTDSSILFLQEQGIEHVISLNSQANDERIKKKLEDNNIAYTSLPIRDFSPPALEQLKEGNEAFRKHKGGTLVWCGYGHGRTGTMITALQIYAEKDKEKEGEGNEDAREIGYAEYRANHVESKGQYEVLDELKRLLATS